MQNFKTPAIFSKQNYKIWMINSTKQTLQVKKRDIGDLAVNRPSSVERVINRASDNALRCVEIAMGAPLTEKEINAIKPSEINSECPSIANPNYVPAE